MPISNSLKHLRKMANLTQKELAERTGIPLRSIINYENGLRDPNSKAMATLESYFQVSGEYLRSESEEQLPEMKWDDQEIIDAIQESFPHQFQKLNEVLKTCSNEDQEAVFTILVEIGHVLKIESDKERTAAMALLRSVFAASTRYLDVCQNASLDIDATRITNAKRTALSEYTDALNKASPFPLE